jgi:catechol 2,3-dioxygenase-like lactoylglutathione lyase family enzyme
MALFLSLLFVAFWSKAAEELESIFDFDDTDEAIADDFTTFSESWLFIKGPHVATSRPDIRSFRATMALEEPNGLTVAETAAIAVSSVVAAGGAAVGGFVVARKMMSAKAPVENKFGNPDLEFSRDDDYDDDDDLDSDDENGKTEIDAEYDNSDGDNNGRGETASFFPLSQTA